MLNFCKDNQIKKLLSAVVLLATSASVCANKADSQIHDVLSNITVGTVEKSTKNLNKSSPNSSVVLDFSIAPGESWDARDSNNNMVASCVNGSTITGFEYNDVSIVTVAGSFFSEAVIYFSDSNNGNNGLRLTAGAGDQSSGTKSFSSNGILDLTDIGLDDIVSQNDGKFFIQFYEKVDDVENAIDARYTDGTVTVWGIDLTPTNDCPFLMTQGVSNSDLSVDYTTDQQANISINDAIEFALTIENNGDSAANNVVLNNTFSEKLALNQITCDDGTNTTDSDDLITLNVQDIAENDSLECIIEASVIAYGFIESTVFVSADNDSNTSNNNATVMVNGAFRVVPINNYIALILLAFSFIYFARKRIS